MVEGCDENYEHDDEVNEGKLKFFHLEGKVLHEGIAEFQKRYPDPSIKVVTLEDWNAKESAKPKAKAGASGKRKNRSSSHCHHSCLCSVQEEHACHVRRQV